LLYSATVLVVAVALLTKDLQPTFALLIVVGVAVLLYLIPFYLMKEKLPLTKPVDNGVNASEQEKINQA
jgi:hypothetical protein